MIFPGTQDILIAHIDIPLISRVCFTRTFENTIVICKQMPNKGYMLRYPTHSDSEKEKRKKESRQNSEFRINTRARRLKSHYSADAYSARRCSENEKNDNHETNQ